MRFIRKFWREQSGVSAMEYSLIAGLVSIVILTAVVSIGAKMNHLFYGPLNNSFN